MTPDLGVTVYSKTRYHADDPTLPLGGVTVDTGFDADTGEAWVKTVTVYRGRIVYTTLDESDIAPGASGGLVRSDVLKGVVLQLAEDELRHRDPFRHDAARRAIAQVLAGHGDRPRAGGRR